MDDATLVRTSLPPVRRARDPEGVRRALREHALSRFNDVGYFGTNTNELARGAGYAAGTFYTQYADKLELFIDVYRLWLDRELADVEAAVAAAPRDERGRAVARVLLDHHTRWNGFRKSLRMLALGEPAVAEIRRAQLERQIAWLRSRAIAYGAPPLDDALAIVTLVQTERVLDAIADGEVARSGIGEAAVLEILAAQLMQLIDPAALPPVPVPAHRKKKARL